MARGIFNALVGTLPRQPPPGPEGLGKRFLWSKKGEWSRNDSLAQLLMPKEWRRVEILRKAKRDRILKERTENEGVQEVPPGIAAGHIVAEEAGGVEEAPEGSREAAAPSQSPEEQHTSGDHAAEGTEREGEDAERGDGDRSADGHAAKGAREGIAEEIAAEANGEAAGSHGHGEEAAADGTGQSGGADEHASGGAAPNAQTS